jgi:uncharacterized protein (DUF2126 family)
MTDDDRAEAIAAHRARHELQRHGLRDSEVGLTVASLTHAYKDDSARLLALVRALDGDPQTEADLDALIAAYAADAEDAQVALERAMKLVTLCDPRRHRLWLASQKAREMAEALGTPA